MRYTGPLFLYSEIKHVEINSGQQIFLHGEPVLMPEVKERNDWMKTIIDTIQKSNDGYEISLSPILKKTKGSFSMIFKAGDSYLLAADVIRSYPLFYGFQNNSLFITDNLEKYQEENGRFEIDNDKLEEYISVGAVIGNKTIYKNVSGLQAGEIVAIKGDNISHSRYFEFMPTDTPASFNNLAEFTKALDRVLMSVFSGMINRNPDVRRWIVPLSGGHDSRLIVNYLYRLGVKNVICFTYGLVDNEQAKISKKVADELGYEWHFVEYTEEKWQELHDRGIVDDYIEASFNGISIPHLQDFLAVYELKNKKIIGKGDIFIPGHSSVTDRFNEYNFSYGDYENVIWGAYRSEIVTSNHEIKSHNVLKSLRSISDNPGIKPENYRAYINWQERQAKFTVNSIRTYEFFGFKHQIPFWDKYFVEFWLDYPANQRRGREILFDAEKMGLLVDKLAHIPYAGANVSHKKPGNKRNLKRLLPNFIIVWLLRLTGHMVELNEGLNQIYALKTKSLNELLDPVGDFPEQTLPYFKSYLKRLPYQMDFSLITRLYTVRKTLDKVKINRA